MGAMTHNGGGIALNYADIVKEGSLIKECGVESAFGMALRHSQSMLCYLTAMQKQQCLQFWRVGIIFMNIGLAIHKW